MLNELLEPRTKIIGLRIDDKLLDELQESAKREGLQYNFSEFLRRKLKMVIK